MSRSSPRRAQTEPLVAIVAVFAVTVGLVAYAGVFESVSPRPASHELAHPTLERIYATLAPTGVVEPSQLDDCTSVGPKEYRVSITLSVEGRTWRAGDAVPDGIDRPGSNQQSEDPTRPRGTDRASRPVSVRLAPGVVRSGRLTVEVWR